MMSVYEFLLAIASGNMNSLMQFSHKILLVSSPATYELSWNAWHHFKILVWYYKRMTRKYGIRITHFYMWVSLIKIYVTIAHFIDLKLSYNTVLPMKGSVE